MVPTHMGTGLPKPRGKGREGEKPGGVSRSVDGQVPLRSIGVITSSLDYGLHTPGAAVLPLAHPSPHNTLPVGGRRGIFRVNPGS